jgi:hypothetical protein
MYATSVRLKKAQLVDGKICIWNCLIVRLSSFNLKALLWKVIEERLLQFGKVKKSNLGQDKKLSLPGIASK